MTSGFWGGCGSEPLSKYRLCRSRLPICPSFMAQVILPNPYFASRISER